MKNSSRSAPGLKHMQSGGRAALSDLLKRSAVLLLLNNSTAGWSSSRLVALPARCTWGQLSGESCSGRAAKLLVSAADGVSSKSQPAGEGGESKALLDGYFYYYMRDFAQVVDKLKADLLCILQKELSWEIFAKEFSVMDDKGARVVSLRETQMLLKKLRRISAKAFGENKVEVDLLIDAAAFREPTDSFRGLQFVNARWKALLGSRTSSLAKSIPVHIEADSAFHLTGKNSIDYLRVDRLLVNGRQLQLWPEAAVAGLKADLPDILTRDLDFSHFSADFTLVDRTGVTVKGLGRNRRLLRLVRDFHERLTRTPLKDRLRVRPRQRFEVNSDGTVDAVLIAAWKYEIDSDPSNPALEQLKAVTEAVQSTFFPASSGLPLTFSGTYTFRFGSAGKICSGRIGSLSINGIGIPDVSLRRFSDTTPDQLLADILRQLSQNR